MSFHAVRSSNRLLLFLDATRRRKPREKVGFFAIAIIKHSLLVEEIGFEKHQNSVIEVGWLVGSPS